MRIVLDTNALGATSAWNALQSLAGRQTTATILADYIAVVELATPSNIPPVVRRDPDDDQVIAAAVAAEADLIVSGDNDLLSIGTYGAVRIVTPIVALRLLTAS